MPINWQNIALIILFYSIAWIIRLASDRLAGWILPFTRLVPKSIRPNEPRRETLRGLFSGSISFIAITIATLASLSLFVDVDTIIWVVGLFSAAFGLGARPLVSDFLTGLSFIFEDPFKVGEKVELSGLPGGAPVEGVIEAVHLRYTIIRAVTGEPFIVPNGEIRVIRNFSRGLFSMASIKIKIATKDLTEALALLTDLGNEAVTLLPNLLEPWKVITESGEMGEQVTLTLVGKAKFGCAADMRPRLLALVQTRLAKEDIPLVG